MHEDEAALKEQETLNDAAAAEAEAALGENGDEINTTEVEENPLEAENEDGVLPAEDETPEPVKPSKRSFQGRIDELTAQRGQAETKALRLQAEVDALRKVVASENKPKQADFEDYDDYVEATARWAARQEKVTIKQEEVQSEVQSAQRSYEDFQLTKLMEAEENAPGFAKAAETLGQVVGPQHELYHAMFESDQFAGVVTLLSQNLKLAAELVRLPSRAQIRALTKLEEEVATNPPVVSKVAVNSPKPTPPSRRVSQAPEPVKPVGGAQKTQKDPAKMTMEEYAVHRRAQMRKNGR